ncbi:hypothetical protein CPB84DRAFT_1764115 [Gymnopilus junonius]|uniref:Uncharacterized protein n=1 Tax=Gymnopilus junonius TaxID=109634 RepID=A0A9P5TU19_GYMJU|nr:hypothetical protein CPB84DRAFT_1764115 [Gymnopilus junonius]
MADLKARIGPKAIPGQFPHKTWVRPGYEAKPSSKRLALWQEERHGTEFDDGSTDDLDSSPVQLNTLTTNSQRKLSLFARMGIDEDTLEPVEVAKSLLDRIEVTADSGKYQDELSFRNATLGSRSMLIDVDALDEDYYDSRPLLNNSQPNVVVKPEPIEVDLVHFISFDCFLIQYSSTPC